MTLWKKTEIPVNTPQKPESTSVLLVDTMCIIYIHGRCGIHKSAPPVLVTGLVHHLFMYMNEQAVIYIMHVHIHVYV